MKSIITIILLSIVANVSAQQITKDGTRYKFENTIYTSYEIGEVLENDWQAKLYYDSFRTRIKKGKKLTLIGLSAIIGSTAYIYFLEKPDTGGTLSEIEDSLILGLGVGLVGTIISLVGLVTNANGYTHLSKSIKIYNRNQPQSKELGYTFNIGITRSGYGISFNF